MKTMPDEAWLAKSADAGHMGKAVKDLVALLCIISIRAKTDMLELPYQGRHPSRVHL